MILEAQAVIEFIGIMMFTSRVGGGAVAILPHIDASIGVPSHTAAIVFPTAILTSSSDTSIRSSVKAIDGTWSYLPLNGDQLSFVTGVTSNGVPAPPTGLDRLKDDWLTYNKGAATEIELDSAYRPPSYTGAVGVVNVTEGSLQACQSATHGRAETTAILTTRDALHINGIRRTGGDSQPWSIELSTSGNPTLAIVNIPSSDLDGTSTAAGGNHYLAYCAMANQSINCPIPIASPPKPCPQINIPLLPIFNRRWHPNGADHGADATARANRPEIASKTPVYRVIVGSKGKRTVTRILLPDSPTVLNKATPSMQRPLTAEAPGSATITPAKSSLSNPGIAPPSGPSTQAMSADCSNTQWP